MHRKVNGILQTLHCCSLNDLSLSQGWSVLSSYFAVASTQSHSSLEHFPIGCCPAHLTRFPIECCPACLTRFPIGCRPAHRLAQALYLSCKVNYNVFDFRIQSLGLFELHHYLFGLNLMMDRETTYINDRLPFRPKFIDGSRLKIGKQSLPFRIGSLFSKISFNWANMISDDALRVKLKEEFFRA
jgi:hypothetical protein